jgi:CheY-like chemotaxis protein
MGCTLESTSKVLEERQAVRTEEHSMSLLKLLVVEDDLPSLELMEEVFTSLEADVRPISDGNGAVDLINHEKYDGIFLDLEMPNMHGFDLARRVRESSWNKSTPIVIVTGRDERSTMQQAFAFGATFFLQKPVDRQKLSGLFRTVRGTLTENRRRQARVPVQTDVLCEVGSRTERGVSWNLSRGGIQIEIGNLKAGDMVRLSFRLPISSARIDAFGVVIWASETRQGIQFTKMSAQNAEAIRQFITDVERPD